jgi:uncharacterized protein (DUF433 family)
LTALGANRARPEKNTRIFIKNCIFVVYFKIIKKRNNMQYLTDRITINADVCNGQPTVRGLRITVQTILEFVFAGDTDAEILDDFPFLEKEDLEACRQFALRLMKQQYIIRPLAA